SKIIATADDGCLVISTTYSFGSGGLDAWVLKLDSTGGVQWQKTYGTSDFDDIGSVRQTSDGGYIAVGTSILGSTSDIFVGKLDPSGSIQWQKKYGGSGNETGTSLDLTSDGGYIVASLTDSFGAGSLDGWILKLDSTGAIQWQKSYGGVNYDALL